jgi:hypothetical protein
MLKAEIRSTINDAHIYRNKSTYWVLPRIRSGPACDKSRLRFVSAPKKKLMQRSAFPAGNAVPLHYISSTYKKFAFSIFKIIM